MFLSRNQILHILLRKKCHSHSKTRYFFPEMFFLPYLFNSKKCVTVYSYSSKKKRRYSFRKKRKKCDSRSCEFCLSSKNKIHRASSDIKFLKRHHTRSLISSKTHCFIRQCILREVVNWDLDKVYVAIIVSGVASASKFLKTIFRYSLDRIYLVKS